MTRQECEAKIIEKLEEIRAIAEEYNPGTGKGVNLYVSSEYANAFRIIENDSPDSDENPVFDIDVSKFCKGGKTE